MDLNIWDKMASDIGPRQAFDWLFHGFDKAFGKWDETLPKYATYVLHVYYVFCV